MKQFEDSYKREPTEPLQPAPQEPEPVQELKHEVSHIPPAAAPPTPKVSQRYRLLQRKAEIDRKLKMMDAKEQEKQRKARTQRLIQNGALAEKYLRCEGCAPEDFEKILKWLVDLPEVRQRIRQQ